MDKKNAGSRKLRSVRVRNSPKVGLIFLRRQSCASTQARERNLHKLTKELIAMQNTLEVEKKRGEELDKATEALRKQHLLRVPMEELSYEQLVELRDKMVNLREKIQERVAELKNQEAVNPSPSDHAECPTT